jgi:thiosulfate/3-mercaptopyruvate sulfurtransferase
MVRARSIIIAVITVIAVLASCQKINDQIGDIALSPLIDITQLSEIIDIPNIKVVDLRSNVRYQQGHIPKAIRLWRTDIEDSTHITKGIRATSAQLQYLLQSKGLNNGDHIVIYDDKGDVDAARLWWLLKLYNYQNVSLLNGGLQAWKRNNLPVSTAIAEVPPIGDIQLGPTNLSLLTNKEQVLSSIYNHHYKIIDARSWDEYSGNTQKNGSARSGRIPGSIFLDYSQTLDENGQFLQHNELKRLISKHELMPEDSLIIYCQSGVRSSHFSFVMMEVLGYPYVTNYDGGWIEWSEDLDLPIEFDSVSFTMN